MKRIGEFIIEQAYWLGYLAALWAFIDGQLHGLPLVLLAIASPAFVVGSGIWILGLLDDRTAKQARGNR